MERKREREREKARKKETERREREGKGRKKDSYLIVDIFSLPFIFTRKLSKDK